MAFTRKRTTAEPPAVLAAKWSGRTLDEGFTPLPKRLLRCMGKLFGGTNGIDDFRVVMAIVDFIRPGLYRWPSYEFLAYVAGMSEQKLKSRVADMQARGLLEAKEIGNGDQVVININGLIKEIERLTDDENESSDH